MYLFTANMFTITLSKVHTKFQIPWPSMCSHSKIINIETAHLFIEYVGCNYLFIYLLSSTQ